MGNAGWTGCDVSVCSAGPGENEGNIHLQMISSLATNLMEEDFCRTVKECRDEKVLQSFILHTIA